MSDLNLIAVVERSRNKAADRTLDVDQRIEIAVVRRQQLEGADNAGRISKKCWRLDDGVTALGRLDVVHKHTEAATCEQVAVRIPGGASDPVRARRKGAAGWRTARNC